MRKTLLLGLGSALALLLSGCGTILSMFGGTGESFIHGTQVTLQGKLLNWPGGTGTIYNVHTEPDQQGQTNPMAGPIAEDGSFSITLTVPPNLEAIYDCNGAYQVSNPGVKVREFLAQVKDKNGNIVGGAQERNTASTDPKVGNKWIMYIYSDGDMTASGTCDMGAKVSVDLNIKKGWNAVVTEITGVDSSGTVVSAKQYMAMSENGFHWYFDAWPK